MLQKFSELMSIRWIEYKGVKVLYTDWRQKAPKQLSDLLAEYTEVLQTSNDDIIHRISDFTGVPIKEETFNLAKEFGRDIFSKKPGKSILIGITGLRKFYFGIYKFATGYSIEIKDSLEEALQYIYESEKNKK